MTAADLPECIVIEVLQSESETSRILSKVLGRAKNDGNAGMPGLDIAPTTSTPTRVSTSSAADAGSRFRTTSLSTEHTLSLRAAPPDAEETSPGAFSTLPDDGRAIGNPSPTSSANSQSRSSSSTADQSAPKAYRPPLANAAQNLSGDILSSHLLPAEGDAPTLNTSPLHEDFPIADSVSLSEVIGSLGAAYEPS